MINKKMLNDLKNTYAKDKQMLDKIEILEAMPVFLDALKNHNYLNDIYTYLLKGIGDESFDDEKSEHHLYTEDKHFNPVHINVTKLLNI